MILLGRHDIVVEILWETAMDYLDYFTRYYCRNYCIYEYIR